MTMIDTADSRFAKAVAIADQAGQWLKCRTHEGKKRTGSARVATRTTCTSSHRPTATAKTPGAIPALSANTALPS
jgi:hypothetical protein